MVRGAALEGDLPLRERKRCRRARRAADEVVEAPAQGEGAWTDTAHPGVGAGADPAVLENRRRVQRGAYVDVPRLQDGRSGAIGIPTMIGAWSSRLGGRRSRSGRRSRRR